MIPPTVITGYHLVLASSVGDRDGVGIELTREDDGRCIAEVFADGESGRRTVSVFERHVPLRPWNGCCEKRTVSGDGRLDLLGPALHSTDAPENRGAGRLFSASRGH